MSTLISVSSIADIPEDIRETPAGLFVEYHNLGRAFSDYSQAQLLIGTCMDHRIGLRIPKNFAYILRSGGANLQQGDFYISYAIAAGGVNTIALVTHTDCGMVNLESRKDNFVQGMGKRAGWNPDQADEYFRQNYSKNEINHEVGFALSEAERLRLVYPGVKIIPLLYRIEDHLLYLIQDPMTG